MWRCERTVVPRPSTRLLLLAPTCVGLAALPSCSDGVGPGEGGGPPPPAGISLELVASGLEAPLFLTSAPGDPRLFVVEQPGRIRVIEDGALRDAPFLDLGDRVSSGGERGLLGLAFHPDHAENGLFYVDYTDLQGNTRVERYRTSPDPDVADPGSGITILTVEQPFANHNGGQLAFGPDGMLYVALGDGGGGGDPLANGQDPGTLLGALLRLDVDGGSPYAVPADNPFAGDPSGRDEVWMYGLRNPWRFAFDPPSRTLWVADVGQASWEEVNVVADDLAGANLGWNVMEGSHCFASTECDTEGLVLPVLEYSHDEGCSITGGFVYRGEALPGLRGHYFYSDFCAGFLRSLRLEAGEAVDRREWSVGDVGRVLSFGTDDRGELYLLTGEGDVHRLVPP